MKYLWIQLQSFSWPFIHWLTNFWMENHMRFQAFIRFYNNQFFLYSFYCIVIFVGLPLFLCFSKRNSAIERLQRETKKRNKTIFRLHASMHETHEKNRQSRENRQSFVKRINLWKESNFVEKNREYLWKESNFMENIEKLLKWADLKNRNIWKRKKTILFEKRWTKQLMRVHEFIELKAQCTIDPNELLVSIASLVGLNCKRKYAQPNDKAKKCKFTFNDRLCYLWVYVWLWITSYQL